MNRNKSLSVLAVIASVAMVATGCSGGTAGPAANTDTIRTTIDVPASFDPTMTQSLPDYILARTSYDTLIRRDASGLVPGLATSWTSTPTSATFTLRKGATCSDGTPITATVVKNSLEYMDRKGAAPVVANTIFGIGTPTITADDAAGKLSIKLSQPWPDMVSGLGVATSGIICPAGLKDPKALAAGTAKGSESGPYVLDSFEPGVSYTYKLRSDYDAWPEWTTEISGKPASTLVYVVSPDSTATANQVISGQLDIAKIQAQTIDRFNGMDGYEVTKNQFSDFYLAFNERKSSVFTDKAKRLAVAHVIDRAMFEKVASSGTGQITTSLAANGVPCVPASNPSIPTLDVESASKVLKGVTIRFVGPNVAGPSGAGNEYIAEALRAAGATVKLTNTDVGSWISTVYGQPDEWDVTMYADLNFGVNLFSPLAQSVGPTIEEGGANFSGVKNPTATAAVEKYLTAKTEEERCTYLNEGVDSLFANGDRFPLVNDPYIYVQRPGFRVLMLGGSLDDPIFRILG